MPGSYVVPGNSKIVNEAPKSVFLFSVPSSLTVKKQGAMDKYQAGTFGGAKYRVTSLNK